MIEEEMMDLFPRYGMSEIQAKIFRILVRLSGAPAADVAVELGVHRSEVYRVARELRDIGLVEERAGRPVIFEPLPPGEALETLLEARTEELERLRENAPRLIEWLKSQIQPIKRHCILVVDDDQGARDSLSLLLGSMGFDTDKARNGGEALEKAGERLHDVALIDIRLPDFSGTDLLRRLKEMNPDIKEIVVTGFPTLENAIEAVNAGADGYMLKPIEHQVLLARINELVKRK